MSEKEVYTPQVIDDQPLPMGDDYAVPVSTGDTKDVKNPSVIKASNIPDKRVAVELIGSALNTKSRKILAEFQFTEMGAISVGRYAPGESGDVRITSNGITARNASGLTTFNLDGDTGDAVFAGTIQAGTLISGKVVVGNNTWVIDGDPETPQFLLYNNNIPEIVLGEVGG